MKTFSFKIYIWTIEILKDVYIKNEIIKHKKRLNLQIDNYSILFNQITLTYLFSLLIRYPSQFYFLNRMRTGGWCVEQAFGSCTAVRRSHTSWGLKMGWAVMDGKRPNQKLPPPPSDLPKCWIWYLTSDLFFLLS